jgi:dolichol-phosphate mannosyltransferase
MNDCIVIIPTYNEIENIKHYRVGAFSTQTISYSYVDDNSPDYCWSQIGTKRIWCRLFWKRKEVGFGAAYVHGFQMGIKNKYDFIFVDADFSHNPNDLESYTMLMKFSDWF